MNNNDQEVNKHPWCIPPNWVKLTLAISPDGRFTVIGGDKSSHTDGREECYLGSERLEKHMQQRVKNALDSVEKRRAEASEIAAEFIEIGAQLTTKLKKKDEEIESLKRQLKLKDPAVMLETLAMAYKHVLDNLSASRGNTKRLTNEEEFELGKRLAEYALSRQ